MRGAGLGTMSSLSLPSFSYGSTEIFVDKVLGVGSYGKVCRAKSGELPCAAKLLHDTLFQENEQRGPGASILTKFEQECQFLSTIRHPNIIQYLDTVSDPVSGRPILLMELMDESLTRFLERSALLYHVQVNICHDVALALAYLHSNTIIHRDLSSNNILLIGEGSRAKVTDFGMSKLTDINPRMTPLTQCPGTSSYMPPEALTTPPHYSSKLDIFSHGVLTIQIITRNFPDPGDANVYVEDSNYPAGRVLVQFLEADRRKKDIDLIEPDHPLRAIALNCIKDRDSDRPSAKELCKQIASQKDESWYVQDVKEHSSAMMLQLELESRECFIDELQEEHKKEMECSHNEIRKGILYTEELKRELETKEQVTQSLHAELQRKTDEVEELQRELEIKERIIKDYQVCLEYKEVQFRKRSEAEKSKVINELRESQAREQQYKKELEVLSSKASTRTRNKDSLQGSASSSGSESIPASHPNEEPRCKTPDKASASCLKFSWTKGKASPEVMSSLYEAAVTHGSTAYFSKEYNIYSYVLSQDKWTLLEQCEYTDFSLAVINNVLTTVGGCTRVWTSTDSLLSLKGRGTRQRWEALLPPMPTPRRHPATVTTPTHLVVAGGRKSVLGEGSSSVEVMDTNALQWTTATANLPQGIAHPLMALCSGYLYISKGTTVYSSSLKKLLSSCTSSSDKLNSPEGGHVWTQISDIPVDYGHTLTALSGHVLAIGGHKRVPSIESHGMSSISQLTGAVHCYDRATNLWTVSEEMPTPRYNALAAVFPGNRVAIVGGYKSESQTYYYYECDSNEIGQVMSIE